MLRRVGQTLSSLPGSSSIRSPARCSCRCRIWSWCFSRCCWRISTPGSHGRHHGPDISLIAVRFPWASVPRRSISRSGNAATHAAPFDALLHPVIRRVLVPSRVRHDIQAAIEQYARWHQPDANRGPTKTSAFRVLDLRAHFHKFTVPGFPGPTPKFSDHDPRSPIRRDTPIAIP